MEPFLVLRRRPISHAGLYDREWRPQAALAEGYGSNLRGVPEFPSPVSADIQGFPGPRGCAGEIVFSSFGRAKRAGGYRPLSESPRFIAGIRAVDKGHGCAVGWSI